jgi:hypothetical protein
VGSPAHAWIVRLVRMARPADAASPAEIRPKARIRGCQMSFGEARVLRRAVARSAAGRAGRF